MRFLLLYLSVFFPIETDIAYQIRW